MNWDSLDRLLDEKRPPLCPGNVIMYYQPGPWVASHDGLRRAIVLSVNKVDGIPLKLDTGEFMTGDAAFRCLGRWCFDRNQFIPKEPCEMWGYGIHSGNVGAQSKSTTYHCQSGIVQIKGVEWEMGCSRRRCRVQDREEASSERGPSLPGPPTEDAERQFG